MLEAGWGFIEIDIILGQLNFIEKLDKYSSVAKNISSNSDDFMIALLPIKSVWMSKILQYLY